LFRDFISLIKLESKASLPAVSTRIKSYFFSSFSNDLYIFSGLFSFGAMKTGMLILSPSCFNCSAAAGRWTSKPIAATLLPLFE